MSVKRSYRIHQKDEDWHVDCLDDEKFKTGTIFTGVACEKRAREYFVICCETVSQKVLPSQRWDPRSKKGTETHGQGA